MNAQSIQVYGVLKAGSNHFWCRAELNYLQMCNNENTEKCTVPKILRATIRRGHYYYVV
jgi:hypothetical protein